MKTHFLNHTLPAIRLTICLLFVSCSSVSTPTSQVHSPATAVITPTVTLAPPIDFSEIKAIHPWRIAFIPKFKFLGETGKLSSYWQPAWEGAQHVGLDFGVDVKLVASDVCCKLGILTS